MIPAAILEHEIAAHLAIVLEDVTALMTCALGQEDLAETHYYIRNARSLAEKTLKDYKKA